MAQITLYVDEKTLSMFKYAAKHEKETISSWAKKRLLTSLHSHWPKRFFQLAGSLKDEDGFCAPQDMSWEKSGRRQSL